MSRVEMTFCMLKTETILFRKAAYIKRRLVEEGFEIVGEWTVRPSVRDIFRMYPGTAARLATVLRFPYLIGSHVYWIRRANGINTMDQTKRALRKEIWGPLRIRGGFVHAPDSVDELFAHTRILEQCKIDSSLTVRASDSEQPA